MRVCRTTGEMKSCAHVYNNDEHDGLPRHWGGMKGVLEGGGGSSLEVITGHKKHISLY